MIGGCWIYETSAVAWGGGGYPLFPIWFDPRRKPDSTEKHKYLQCGPETVQWRLLCNPGALPGFFFSSSCTYSKLTQRPLKEWLWSGVIEEDVLVHHTGFLQNSSVRLLLCAMINCIPPLCLPHSWSPPAVGVGCPDMPPPAVHGNIWKHVHT